MRKAGMGRSGPTVQGARAAAAAAAVLVLGVLVAPLARAATPTVSAVRITEANSSAVKLEGAVNPEGNETRYRFEYGVGECSSTTCTKVPVPEGKIPAGTSAVAVNVKLSGLPSGTAYHVRLVAKNSEGTKPGPEGVFATYSAPLSGLPEGRVYEQASPVDKNGGDAVGLQALVKATPGGDGVTFASTFGFPGEIGAQTRSTYLGSRGAGNWSTRGMLPPESFGEGAQVLGWLPDFTQTYSSATKNTAPPVEALIAQPSGGGAAVQMTAYVPAYIPGATYAYAGATPGGGVVFFEALAKLPPKPGELPIAAAIEGAANLYAWDRESGEVHLVSVLNDESSPPLGGLAGPYDWARGGSAFSLRIGGGARNYYLQDGHAVRPDGSIYFTAAGTGQLYLRENPTAPQSDLEAGKCTQPARACTIHVSASKKENGNGPGGTDSGGPQPAAFQASTEDGSQAFFTSSEMLTDNANTGPEQPPAAIVRDTINGDPGNIEPNFIPKRAVGLVEDSEYLYWADPADGTIGRAKLDGSEPPNDAFIVPGPVGCGEETEPGVFEEEAPSKPRYVAVDAEHIYWTNTGCLVSGEPELGGGTIGRADIEGETASVEAEFIPGKAEPEPGKVVLQVSDPQGISVNASHIYWANAPENEPVYRVIARAAIGGGAVEAKFWGTKADRRPFGVALDASHVYYGENDEENSNGFVERIGLNGGEESGVLIGEAGVRGVAVDAEHLYWASQGETAIGRLAIGGFGSGGECETTFVECEKNFISVSGTPSGMAADAEHLFWSVNGETSPNPGNDLYSFEPKGGALTDLTPDPTGDGAEALGVLGVSANGSYLYFAANGDLDGEAGPALPGDCHAVAPHGPLISLSGHCNIYLRHEGAMTFVARVHAGGGEQLSDAFNWAPTPIGIGGAGAYLPRTALLGDDGRVLVFRSQDSLTAYPSHGVPQYYLYRAGEAAIHCITCNPSGEAPGEGPQMARIQFPPGVSPPTEIWAALSRNLSADGSRFFFETPEALSPADTNGGPACEAPITFTHQYPYCEDVYEWEAPGAGSCEEGGPSYAPLNAGCIYLVSSGKSPYPSLFGDASESGKDVFFFTRQSLVGQDEDELQDVYDARVQGGLPSQNPPHPPVCESAEACHGPEQRQESGETRGSSTFQGPSDPTPKRKKAKHHHKRHHGHGHPKHHRGSNSKGRPSR